MTIENPTAYLASIWDWGALSPCFPRGAKPTDIDGMVELGGYFLVLEGKAPGVPVKEGQRRIFDRMTEWNKQLDGLFTVIVFWGTPSVGMESISRIQLWPDQPKSGSWRQLREYINGWAEWAEERAAIRDEGIRGVLD